MINIFKNLTRPTRNVLKRCFKQLCSLLADISGSSARNKVRNFEFLLSCCNSGWKAFDLSTWQIIEEKTLSFVHSMRFGETCQYRYSPSCSQPTLYASVYACLIRGLYDNLDNLSEKQKMDWVAYFDSFQSPNDGLFRDPATASPSFDLYDWWGSRHLLLHILPAYTLLGAKPKYPLSFLERYLTPAGVSQWLDSLDWNSEDNDIDNQIMNIGASMQYARDYLALDGARDCFKKLLSELGERIYPDTGMWSASSLSTPEKLSRSVQFAYHLYPLFKYDNVCVKYSKKLVMKTLETQNALGGFGVPWNSSACEDMDSAWLLIRLCDEVGFSSEANFAIRRFVPWCLANLNDDGGFVFRRNESMIYGHHQMQSVKNESALFPTWFRSLALVLCREFLDRTTTSKVLRCPGYYS